MPNRLANETSPYLLQHAHNPVDWYPWGDEALETARREEKPVFLSIGYSACHWCHVMERESFESDAIAALMNAGFVNVKVDREERPDLDQIYMSAVVALTGRGGWPMSVFLTPDGKPFHGGTYWPPERRTDMPGFPDVLAAVRDAWENRRDDVLNGANQLTSHVVENGQPVEGGVTLGEDLLDHARRVLLRVADRTFGGFGRAPKFPHPMDLRVLLRCAVRFDDTEAREFVEFTLLKMAAGGIYDHLGGGFARYSTDERWLVPHFEKMLYDNALLVTTFVEAWQTTGNDAFARVVRETCDYVLREMTGEHGGFLATQDADSEGVEGKFFVWSKDEIEQHLPAEDARRFCHAYDVTDGGNWEGKNVLNRPRPDAETAGVSVEELQESLARSRQALFDARSRRVAPDTDEKVLASWNGLMIAATAKAGAVLGEVAYVDAARRAADFVLGSMRDENGRLLHTFKDGRARFNAYLDDYAGLVDGLVELFQACQDATYLDAAVELADDMVARFGDAEHGGFFYTSDDHEELIARNKDGQDNATPSGNGMAATALLKLARLTGRTDLEGQAVRVLDMLSGQLARGAMASGQSLIALDFLIGPTKEIVLVDGQDASATEPMLDAVRRPFLPNAVLLRRPDDVTDDDLPESVRTLLTGKTAVDGGATAYVCEQGVCHEPVTDVDALRQALEA